MAEWNGKKETGLFGLGNLVKELRKIVEWGVTHWNSRPREYHRTKGEEQKTGSSLEEDKINKVWRVIFVTTAKKITWVPFNNGLLLFIYFF